MSTQSAAPARKPGNPRAPVLRLPSSAGLRHGSCRQVQGLLPCQACPAVALRKSCLAPAGVVHWLQEDRPRLAAPPELLEILREHDVSETFTPLIST